MKASIIVSATFPLIVSKAEVKAEILATERSGFES